MSKLTTFLWFDGKAEEAARFYASVFPNGKVGDVTYYGENMPLPAGTVLTAEFEIFGQAFVALNGGPHFKFSEAVSFQIPCENQAEVDRYWDTLIADGGEPGPCGWLKDRYGLSWQVTPTRLMQLLHDPDKAKADRATQAMMQMGKIDIAAIEAAAEGVPA
ncbi:MAG TPA: VOC family protein [Caulobacteraceae bacterium]|jgi:predicted 3-demethylubiquinone-9 3-methyltransferase (glyoxalase superfamily)|nr:VOC family protein [Caulobacteraceae bacterium]